MIEKSWKYFTAEVLDWFTLMLRREYGIADFPLPRYPLSWPELKAKMEATFASAFSVNYVWRDLTNLRRGRDIVAFHNRFTNLARPVGESPDTALYDSRLRDAIAVLDEGDLRHGGSQSAGVKSTAAPSTTAALAGSSTALAPGPMELSAFSGAKSDSIQCARCRGYGHWSSACVTPRNWRRGDPIAGRTPGSGGGRGSSGGKGGKGNFRAGARSSRVYNTEANLGDEVDRDEENGEGSEAESGRTSRARTSATSPLLEALIVQCKTNPAQLEFLLVS